MQKKIFISSGYKRIHLISNAKILIGLKTNVIIFCGFVTNPNFESLIKFLKIKSKKIEILISRRIGIPYKYFEIYLIGEFIHEMALFFKNLFNMKKLSNSIIEITFKSYSKKIKKYLQINRNKFDIYHYRSGFGGCSVDYAKSIGLKCVCDHSIAHPSLVDYMIKNNGNYPKKNIKIPNNFWRLVLEDINKAENILVNSEFVKKTLSFMGITPNKIKVIYIGLEDHYFKLIKKLPKKNYSRLKNKPIKFLFAGGIVQRKGFDQLYQAFNLLEKKYNNFELHIAGSLNYEFKIRYKNLFKKDKIKYHGVLKYDELIRLMFKSDVFVFPSLVEGSAKVIFEAMGCGCAIITTPNTGSVVKDKLNGILVRTGKYKDIYLAMQKIITNTQLIKFYGKSNQRLIKQKYTPTQYGKKLIKYYNSL